MSLSFYDNSALDRFFLDPWASQTASHVWSPLSKIANNASRQLAVRNGGIGALDVVENDAEWTLTVDTPGMTEADIKVQSHPDNRLTISGERKSETEDKDKGYYERSYGTFSRSIRLSDTADAENIKARMKNGVLQVTVPKKEPLPKPEVQTIPVETVVTTTTAQNDK